MNIKYKLGCALNRVLLPLGYQLTKHPPPVSRWTMKEALKRAAAVGIQPATLIDVGAAQGHWAQMARQIFPSSRALLIEPLAERRECLLGLIAAWPESRLETAVAGETGGAVAFNITEDPDGSGVYGRHGDGVLRTLPQVGIDELVDRYRLPGPFLLKLDTHGYEVPIFRGAIKTLTRTDLIVVEAYGFNPSPTSVRFWELCSWLHDNGFRPADIAGLMGRRRDGLFWQADLFFLRADHPAFRSNSYV